MPYFEVSDNNDFLKFDNADQVLDQCIRDGSIKKIRDDRLMRLPGYHLVRHNDNPEKHVFEEETIELMNKWKQ